MGGSALGRARRGRGGGTAGVPAVGVGGTPPGSRGWGIPGGCGLRGSGGGEGLLLGGWRGPALTAALVGVGVSLVVVVEDELLFPGRLVGAVRLVLAGVLGPAGSAHAAVGDDLEGAALGDLGPAGDRLDGEQRGDRLHLFRKRKCVRVREYECDPARRRCSFPPKFPPSESATSKLDQSSAAFSCEIRWAF